MVIPSITSVIVLLGIHTDTSVIAAIIPGGSLNMYCIVGVTAHIYTERHHNSLTITFITKLCILLDYIFNFKKNENNSSFLLHSTNNALSYI